MANRMVAWNTKMNHDRPDPLEGATRRDLVEPLPDLSVSFREAIAKMVDRSFIGSVRYEAQQSRADRNGCHPDILEFEKRLVTRMRKQGVPLFCVCAWRGAAAQEAAMQGGFSNAKWGSSPHNYGMAVDIIHGVQGYGLERKSWEILGHIGKEISVQSGIAITWGGDWKSPYDPAHWELKEWKLARASRKPGQRWT